MARLIRTISLTALLTVPLAMSGCANEPADAPEPQASKESAQAEAAGWTEEQKSAFQSAHERARKGEDDK
ncbi:MAG: hypothetical protein JST30_05840 [Armatimonadetes bacterium]|nr:hypothetical protein [Armatimonadota bacterium]